MTVSELIEELRLYPKDMKVIGVTNGLITSVSKSTETYTDVYEDDKEFTEEVVNVC